MEILFWCILISILFSIIIYGILLFSQETCQIFFWKGVPYVKSNKSISHLFLENISLDKNDVFVDIGCGNGQMLEQVKEKFPMTRVIWYEISPRPYQEALKRKKESNWEYEIYKKDFFKTDLWEATVIYSYTISYLMDKIWKKVSHDCKKWTILYSNSFEIKWVHPTKIFTNEKKEKLYMYIL